MGLRSWARSPKAPREDASPREADGKRGLSGAVIFFITNLAYFVCAALIPAHLLFAVEEHSFAVRILTAIPAIVLVLEAQSFLKKEAGELPFVVLALLQYYAVFCFGVFFHLKFFDVRGPVSFSEQARTSGAAAVALGSICIWAGARLGRRIGNHLGPTLVKAMPRAEVPEQWDQALLFYAGVTALLQLVIVFFPNIIPPTLAQPFLYTFPIELAIGFAIGAPLRKNAAKLTNALVGVTMAIGMLRGSMEYVFRGGIAYVAGRWAATRTVSLRLAAGVVLLYAVVQPVKGAYRQQVWTAGARQTVGVSERVSAWGNAFSPEGRSVDEGGDGAMGRLSELGAVMHAFDVLPGRVQFLDGSGFLPVLYAPIPRFMWQDKPTTQQTVQRYGVVFGRQTEGGARTTAFNLPLLVEGYWNFGWAGIVFVCGALGLWVGLSQKMFAGGHWAMRATGMANVTNLSVAGPIVYVYGSIFQMLAGRLFVCWSVFWLAQLLSRREYEKPKFAGGRALLRR
ncbi:MAG: hypothetical protein QM820_58820 [Minicystis sp.]